MTWTTYEGVRLQLDGLTLDEVDLFNRAQKMFEAKAGMEAIAQLYLAKDSVLYRGRTGAQVVMHPLYQALKDMAKRRGIEDGLLSADQPGSSPDLDDFEVSRAN